jgi:hypothetical protein
VLEHGFWRHSNATKQMWRCKSSGDWSPCKGGVDAGSDGDGYCDDVHHGPRCELCINGAEYFDTLEASCKDCGDVNARAAAGIGIPVGFAFLAVVARAAVGRRYRDRGVRGFQKSLLRRVRRCWKLWRRAGMRYKVKALVSLYQCVAAAPSVFDVTVPNGLEEYTRWVYLMTLPSDLGADLIVPAGCFDSFRQRLLISSSWPIALLVVAATSSVIREIARDTWQKASNRIMILRSRRAAVLVGLQHTLPLALLLSFLLVPSTSTRLFKTFLCEPIEYDMQNTTRRCLCRLHSNPCAECAAHCGSRFLSTVVCLHAHCRRLADQSGHVMRL